MELFSEQESLLESINGLRNSHREQAADEIRAHIEAAARELSLEKFALFESSLYHAIFSLVHSDIINEKVGGVLAISELIDCTSAAIEQKVIKFANTLGNTLKTAKDYNLIQMIASCLGSMARHTTAVSHADYVERELDRSLEWLRGGNSHRILAACALLKQFAANAPTIFSVRSKDFFDLIWRPLCERRIELRYAAAGALSASLRMLRSRTYHLMWYCSVYDHMLTRLNDPTMESVHGSLLVVTELLRNTGAFMLPRFREVCKTIMKLSTHESLTVRAAIVNLLPELAFTCPDIFARYHLEEAAEILTHAVSQPILLPCALLGIGKLCRAIGKVIVYRCPELMEIVKNVLNGSVLAISGASRSGSNHATYVATNVLAFNEDDDNQIDQVDRVNLSFMNVTLLNSRHSNVGSKYRSATTPSSSSSPYRYDNNTNNAPYPSGNDSAVDLRSRNREKKSYLNSGSVMASQTVNPYLGFIGSGMTGINSMNTGGTGSGQDMNGSIWNDTYPMDSYTSSMHGNSGISNGVFDSNSYLTRLGMGFGLGLGMGSNKNFGLTGSRLANIDDSIDPSSSNHTAFYGQSWAQAMAGLSMFEFGKSVDQVFMMDFGLGAVPKDYYHRYYSLSNQINGSSSNNTSSTNAVGGNHLGLPNEALQCLQDMVLGLGSAFHDNVGELLEVLLSSGLSPKLIETLSTIATHLPAHRSFIQSQLLMEVTRVLGLDPLAYHSISQTLFTEAPGERDMMSLRHQAFSSSNNGSTNSSRYSSSNSLFPFPSNGEATSTTSRSGMSLSTPKSHSKNINSVTYNGSGFTKGWNGVHSNCSPDSPQLQSPQVRHVTSLTPGSKGSWSRNNGSGSVNRGALTIEKDRSGTPRRKKTSSSNSLFRNMGILPQKADAKYDNTSDSLQLDLTLSIEKQSTPGSRQIRGNKASDSSNNNSNSNYYTSPTHQGREQQVRMQQPPLQRLSWVSPNQMGTAVSVGNKMGLMPSPRHHWSPGAKAGIESASVTSKRHHSGMPFNSTSTPSDGEVWPSDNRRSHSPFTGSHGRSYSDVDAIVDNKSSEAIMLALTTLGMLTTPTAALLPLVQRAVLPYLEAQDFRIRTAAVATCANLILPADQVGKLRGPTARSTELIISRLLEVAVSDSSAQVRLCVLHCLHAGFDCFLSQSKHIDRVMFLFSDDLFEIRSEALRILGRLARYNPASVLPELRQILLLIISQIRNSYDAKMKEEATLLLSLFLKTIPGLHRMVKGFVGSLISSINGPTNDARLITACLEAVGELCMVMREDVLPYVDQLTPMVILNMQDGSSQVKQEIAVRTLGQLVTATGMVIRPYLRFPDLLPKALDLLLKSSASTPWSLRREVLRTLGLLGALEPQKYSLILDHLKMEQSRKAEQKRLEDKEHAAAFGNRFGNNSNILNPLLIHGGGGGNKMNSSPHTAIGMIPIQPKPIPTRGSQLNINSNNSTASDRNELDRSNGNGNGNGKGSPMTSNNSPANNLGHSPNHMNATAADSVMPTAVVVEEDSANDAAYKYMYSLSSVRSQSTNSSEKEIIRKTPASEDYYPQVAITALMKILRDPNLDTHHSAVTQALMHIFKSLGMRCVPFLEQIVPYLLITLRKCGQGLRDSLLQQMSQLAKIIKYHMAPYLPALFEIVQQFWNTHSDSLLYVVEEVALACPDHFEPFLPQIIPLLLSSLTVQKSLFGGLESTSSSGSSVSGSSTTDGQSQSHYSDMSRSGTVHVLIEGERINNEDDDEDKPWLIGAAKTIVRWFETFAKPKIKTENKSRLNPPQVTLVNPKRHDKLRHLERTLSCVDSLRRMLKSELHLFLPQLSKLAISLHELASFSYNKDLERHVRMTICAMHRLCSKGALAESQFMASRVVHCIVKILVRERGNPEIRDEVLKPSTTTRSSRSNSSGSGQNFVYFQKSGSYSSSPSKADAINNNNNTINDTIITGASSNNTSPNRIHNNIPSHPHSHLTPNKKVVTKLSCKVLMSKEKFNN